MISHTRALVLGTVILVAVLVVGCGSRWLAGGKLHFDQKRYEQALENFEKAVAEKPDDGEAHLWLGRALAELERDERAVPEIHKASELVPEGTELSEMVDNTLVSYWSLRYNSGLAYAKDAATARDEAANHRAMEETELAKAAQERAVEKLELAVDRFERAMIFCPDTVKNYSNLGKVLFQLGQREEGMEMFRKAREMAGDRVELQNFLFLVFRSLGIQALEERTPEGYERALDMFDEATTFDRTPEEMATIYFNMGIAGVGLADELGGDEKAAALRKAVDYYGKVLDVDPEDTAALTNLAHAHLDLDEKEQALELGQRLVDVEPWKGEFHFILGRMYNAAGKREEYAAHLMLQSSLDEGKPLPMDNIREIVRSYGPGSDMLNTLRDRGEPEQLYEYFSTSRGAYDIWWYWTDGRVYIFKKGKEVFRDAFKAVETKRARELNLIGSQ